MADFNNSKSRPDGKSYWCKKCKNKSDNDRYYANRERILAEQKLYYEKNKEKILKRDKIRTDTSEYKERKKTYDKEYHQRESSKERARQRSATPEAKKKKRESDKRYIKENPDKITAYFREYSKNRKQKDFLYKFRVLIGSRIYKIFKELGVKKESSEKLLGCTFEFAKSYIESLFKSGMTWDNYGKEWDIDHKEPLGLADTKEELIRLNYYTNLQPLWKNEHHKKTAIDNKLIKAKKKSK